MSAKFVSDWFPWFYTEKEREAISRQHQNEQDFVKSAILTDYNNPNPQPSNNPHAKQSPEVLAAEAKNLREGKKKRPQLNYTINWNGFSSTSSPVLLQRTFVQSHLDEETKNWILGKSNPSATRQSMSDAFAKWFGRTSANGLCFRGEMFVFSRFQMKKLLEKRLGLLSASSSSSTLSSMLSGRNENDNNEDENNKSANNFIHPSSSVLSRYNRSSSSSSSSIVAEMGQRDINVINVTYKEEMEGEKNDDMYRKIMRNLIYNFESTNDENHHHRPLSVLDIGAGDGGVTRHVFAPFFENVFTTEDNPVMRCRLKSNFGWWNCYSSSETSDLLKRNIEKSYDKTFDLVALLNVLDRCDKPLTLLKEIREQLLISAKSRKDAGVMANKNNNNDNSKDKDNKPPLFILAVVLPFCPFVENGNKKDEPSEPLMLQGGGLCREGATFERSLEKLVTNVLVPVGFKICAWTRVPYLCEGDARCEYYCLDDALFLLEAVDE